MMAFFYSSSLGSSLDYFAQKLLKIWVNLVALAGLDQVRLEDINWIASLLCCKLKASGRAALFCSL